MLVVESSGFTEQHAEPQTVTGRFKTKTARYHTLRTHYTHGTHRTHGTQGQARRCLAFVLAVTSLFCVCLHHQALGTQSPTQATVCRGQDLFESVLHPDQSIFLADTTLVRSDRSSLYRTGRSCLKGHVTLDRTTRPGLGQHGEADLVYLNRNREGQIETADFLGHVLFKTPDYWLKAPFASYRFLDNQGYAQDILYRLKPEASWSRWGQAETWTEVEKGYYLIKKASMTTCPPTGGRLPWVFYAKQVAFDKRNNQIRAYHSHIQFYGVPIVYLPYYQAPIEKARQTGFLWPQPGLQSQSGFGFAWPFYWNIAPAMDMTLTPQLYAKRGLALSGAWRYLMPRDFPGQDGQGMLTWTWLPKDALTHQQHRYSLNFNHSQRWSQTWRQEIRIQTASDDAFFKDLGGLSGFFASRDLPQETTFLYQKETLPHQRSWDGLIRFQRYQILQPYRPQKQAFSEVPSSIYDRLPQIQWQTEGETFLGFAEFTAFQRPRLSHRSNTSGQSGSEQINRWVIQPQWRLPGLYRAEGYLSPSVFLQARSYTGSLGNQQSLIPAFTLDSGLWFNRQSPAYQQRLEPRLFYAWVPYVKQDALPILDTAVYPFDYHSLFRFNRFSGWDRLNDTHQISFALTTRQIRLEDGFQPFRLSMGQSVFLKRRKIGLKQSAWESFSPTDRFSPLVVKTDIQWHPTWSFSTEAAFQITPKKQVAEQIFSPGLRHGEAMIHYRPTQSQHFFVFYDYTPHPSFIGTHQLGLSGSSPLTVSNTSLYWLAHLSYNLKHRKPQTLLFGVSYESCCWASRLFGANVLTDWESQIQKARYRQGVFLQFELKGLGSAGDQSLQSLLSAHSPNDLMFRN